MARSAGMTTVTDQLQGSGSAKGVTGGLVTKGRGTEEMDVFNITTSDVGEAANAVLKY